MFVRDRLSDLPARWSGRPTLFAVAVMNVIVGLAVAQTLGPMRGWDSGLFRDCAMRLVDGNTEFCGFLYSPLAALAARPLTWVSPSAATMAMTLLSIAIIVIGVMLETGGKRLVDRLLIVTAALSFAPVVYEILLGQTTLLLAATLFPVSRRRDAFRNGIPLGIALALAPKPLLLPILIWMLVWRRRALVSALMTAAAATGLGVAVVGSDQYRDWMSVLAGAGRESMAGTFTLSLHSNFSLWPLSPLTFVLACGVGAVTLWAIWHDISRGYVAALFGGLLLAPYSGLYAFSLLLLAVGPAVAFAPRLTRALALTAGLALALVSAALVWNLAGLATCLSLGGNARTPLRVDPT